MVHAGGDAANAQPPRYSGRQRAILLDMARRTLAARLALHALDGQAVAAAAKEALAQAADAERAPLLEPRACFVTLRKREGGELRGCRGECVAHQPLVAAVGWMALASATDDPRFAPVTAAELAEVRIEISVLTPLAPIAPEDVAVGRHGLMIVAGSRRGLLLPQVAVEHGLGREGFLAAVCWKAGLSEDAWRAADVSLWAFESEVWEEL